MYMLVLGFTVVSHTLRYTLVLGFTVVSHTLRYTLVLGFTVIGRKEGNILFNNTLNKFYLRLCGVGHVVVREEAHCCHMGYSFWLAASVLLYTQSHTQDGTYHNLCYTSCEALAGTRNSSMGPPWKFNPTIHHTMSEWPYHGATSRSYHNRVYREREMFSLTTHSTHFYLRLYGVRHMVKDHSDSEKYRLLVYRLTARVLLYAPSHRQDDTYPGLCYTSRGTLAGMS